MPRGSNEKRVSASRIVVGITQSRGRSEAAALWGAAIAAPAALAVLFLFPDRSRFRRFVGIEIWIERHSSAMVVSPSGSSTELDGGITRLFAPPPLSPLPSETNVMCSCAGLLPVKNVARDGVQRGEGA